MNYTHKGLGLLLAAACACNPAWAEDKPGAREREALRRVQTQLQSVQQAQGALQDKLRLSDEEKSALEQRLKGMQARERSDGQKAKQLQEGLDKAQAENQTVQTAKTELEQRLKLALEQIAMLEKDQAQTGAQLKAAQAALGSRTQQVNACEQRNAELYGLGRTLVAQCKDGHTDATQLPQLLSGAKQVGFETRMEALRDQLDSQRILPTERAQ